MKYIIISILTLSSLCILQSCNKWIDVKPTDRLSEDVLFESSEGYMKALNGVYIEMGKPELYGQFMSSGAVDVMAQYYFMTTSTHQFYDFTNFRYGNERPKTGFDQAWRKAYELIANLNVIIEKCGEQPSDKLPQPYHGIVKGEALALRALLHFDMLRLFGPIYNDDNKRTPAIPYYSDTALEVAPLRSSEEILSFVQVDLAEAKELLQDSDPILSEGVRADGNPTGSNAMYYRQYRLNYYAIQTLLARTYLWQGDKIKALQSATETLDQIQTGDDAVFPFVTFAAATHGTKPDRVFSTEVMFALYTVNKPTTYATIFDANLVSLARLSFNAGNSDMSRVNDLYQNNADYRYRIWENVNVAGASILTNQKYKDYLDAPGRYMLPMIRLSELYLIAAECTDDEQYAIELINTLRTHRNIPTITPQGATAIQAAITSEFRKEMLGEGQMFYYYKRHSFETVPNNAALVGTKAMALENYQAPLPDSEISMR